MEDIEKIAAVEGISDYNITTVPTAVLPVGFERIEDAGTDQTGDLQGVALVGNLDMTMDDNVLGGNVTIKEGRMTTAEDSNVCVISEELAEKNHLEVGDSLRFCPVKEEEPVQEAVIVGIYQVKERMEPYMSGDTYRSENVISRTCIFRKRWSRTTRCMRRRILRWRMSTNTMRCGKQSRRRISTGRDTI